VVAQRSKLNSRALSLAWKQSMSEIKSDCNGVMVTAQILGKIAAGVLSPTKRELGSKNRLVS
jgi:hypothetical protein